MINLTLKVNPDIIYVTPLILSLKPLIFTLTLGKNPLMASKQLQLKAVPTYKAVELPQS